MFRNYLKIALRVIMKNKTFSLINVMGLTIGMTAFLFIIKYVQFELSYDDFNDKNENIYRVESRFFNGDVMTDDWATSSYGYGPAMKREFPEVVEYARLNLWNCERVVSYKDDVKFREKNVFMADSNFLTMFNYPLVTGDSKTALTEPNSVVISQKMAKKYFANESPMGKMLTLRNSDGEYVCQVTGILKDIPDNSHVQFDILISWRSISSHWAGIDEFWYQHEAYTYVLLKPGANLKALESKFPVMAEKYKTGDALKHLKWGIQLVSLNDIHLNTYKSYEREVKGNRTGVWALLAIAFIVLIIAWVNYFNLTTARAVERAKEVGLRKVCGAFKKQLVLQFLIESAIINIAALFLTLIITQIAGNGFVQLTGLSESIDFSISSPSIYGTSLILIFSGILFGGLYPSYLMAQPTPAKILKGSYSHSRTGILLRKSLIVFQFTISIILISGTILIYKQISYMQDQELGAGIDNMLIVKTPVASDFNQERIKSFHDELVSTSSIKNVTMSSSVPGKEVAMFLSNYRADDANHETKLYEMLRTDYDFVDTYGLKMKYGRNFSREFETDDDKIILTEAAVKLFGFDDDESVIGKEIVLEGSSKKNKIIGVVENYHHQTLKLGFKPIIIFMSQDHSWIVKNYFSIKFSGNNVADVVNTVENKWASFFPATSFDYFFLDEFFDAQYKADRQFGMVFFLFAGLAIFIACIGLFGLVSFTTKQKTKEIGIRKTVGASVKDISVLLLKEFMTWVFIANIIALPLAWIIISGWLNDFAFRINLSEHVWVFAVSAIIIFAITLATLTSLVMKAAKANLIESLKYE